MEQKMTKKNRWGPWTVLFVGVMASGTVMALDITVDPAQLSARPFLKSKLGFARATGFDRLPDSMPLLSEVGARAFCTTLNFDGGEGGRKENYAVDANTFTAKGLGRPGQTNAWFDTMQARLQQQGIAAYIGLVGAPEPFHAAVIRKPAEHPTPLDIDGAAKVLADWAKPYLNRYPNTNWVVWNEPEHALRGTNSAEAAGDMAKIYQSYLREMDPVGSRDRFGLAAFMKGSLRPTSGEPGKNFFQSVMDRVAVDPITKAPVRIDYVTMNNYHGKTDEFLAMMQGEMGRRHLDQPLIFSQFAPWQIGERAALGGTNEAGGLYIQTLDGLMDAPSIQHVCMSFWAGIDNKSFVQWNKRSNSFERSNAFAALAMYQRMAPWRLNLNASQADPDVQVYASVEAGRTTVLLINQPGTDEAAPDGQALAAKAGGKEARKADRKAARKAQRQEDRQAGRAHADSNAQAVHGEQRAVKLTFKGLPSQAVRIERLLPSSPNTVTEQGRTDEHGALQVGLGPQDIVLIQAGSDAGPQKAPWTVVHDVVYVHRVAPNGTVIPEGQLGVASFDALHDGYVMAVPSSQATAHAAAWLGNAPTDLAMVLTPPPGVPVAGAQSCMGVVAQYLNSGREVGVAAWGSKEAVSRMLKSRDLAGPGPVPTAAPLAWQTRSTDQGQARLDLQRQAPAAWDKAGGELKLHVGLGACARPTHAQLQLVP
jgi:hypothetical protein